MPIDLQGSYERTKIESSTRALLCVFAAGTLDRSLPRLEVDWGQVFQAVCQNGLVGLTYRYLDHQADSSYPPPEFRQSLQQAYRTLVLRMARLYHQIRQLATQLTEEHLNFLIVKGPALAYTVYPDPVLRSFNDLDLVVRERDWHATWQILTARGFQPEDNLPKPPPKLAAWISPYESKYWQTETKFLVEVHYDDFLNAGLASRDVDGFWTRAVKIDLDGTPVQVLSLEDQLTHACAHMHFHGYTRLNWLSDIAMIVRDHADQLNWQRALDIVRTEEAQVGMYYSLYFVEQLLQVPVPDDVLAALRPDGFRRWWHERLLPEAQVLSLQPMDRPTFSFYFIPLLKRLLPDLLVMGRRREKLTCLIRLWIPPQSWLKYYYHLTDDRTVRLHYLLHPLKLIAHYLTEILSAIFRHNSKPSDT
jgi:hypothetical protein